MITVKQTFFRIKDAYNLKRKAKASIFDYKEQARDISWIWSNEILPNNDFYGHAYVLKRFVWGKEWKKHIIAASIEHGMFPDTYIWEESELRNNPFPTILTSRKARIKTYEGKTDKKIIPVGPIIAYTTANYSEVIELKEKFKRTLVVFPTHSTHYTMADYDVNEFCDEIEKVAKEFDTVLICLYWKDILRGFDEEYKARGWRLVSAGHMFDKNFLYRSRIIFELADCIMTNGVGDQIGQAVYFNKPVYLYRQKCELTFAIASEQKSANSLASVQLREAIMNEFDVYRDSVSVQQREFCNYYFGLDCVQTREELGRILDEMDNNYQKMLKQIAR